jgi:tyrosine-protein kinase
MPGVLTRRPTGTIDGEAIHHMHLNRYLTVLRRRLWIILACPLIAAAVATVANQTLPPVYEARVVLLVRPAQPLAVSDTSVAALTSDQISATYARLMTERPLLEQVAQDVGMGAGSNALAGQIKVTPEAGTTILDVAVQDTDRVRAARTGNILVADFIADIKQIQREESGNPNARSADNFVLVSPAIIPDQPVAPNKVRNVVLALVAGLVLAALVAFLVEYLDQTVKSDQDLSERTGIVPIGHIGFVAGARTNRGELIRPGQPIAEAYKALRTNLLFSSVDRRLQTLVITSSLPGEGKSRTTANLAIVLAEAGHRTLVVDADLRRPSQHRMFGRIRHRGLADLVAQGAEQPDVVHRVERVPNLWLLSAGTRPPNPSELLGSGRMKALIDKLREEFTYLLLDTPPLAAVTDAAVLATHCDATLLVVEQGKTPVSAVVHARETLERVGAPLAGAVLNKIRSRTSGYYYAYGYGEQDGERPAPPAAAPDVAVSRPTRAEPPVLR